jgi:hypothetical protein
MGADSIEKVVLETQPLDIKVAETDRKTEHESDEKKTGSVFVADKRETQSVTGKEVESDMQHNQEAQNIEHKSVDSVDKTEGGAEIVEDKREIIEEPVKELGIKTEENEKYDDEEDEEEEYDDDDDDDDNYEDEDPEREVSEEVTELPNTDVQKTVEEVKSINIIDATSQASDVDALKLKDPDAMHLSLQSDTNVSDASVDNGKADGPNLQENVKDVLLQVELPENVTDVYETSEEIAADKPSALAHSTPLPASESQNMYVSAAQTESSVGSAEELKHTQIGKLHENDTDTEENGSDEQVDTHQASADTEDQLSSDHSVEGKEMIGGSGEIINSVVGNPEDISENLKTQNINVHPELVSDEVTNYSTETSSEVKVEIQSNVFEEPHTDSMQEEMKTTTATPSEEQYYEVPLHEPSTEETSTAASTFTSEEPLLPVEDTELMSEEGGIIKSSGGLFSDITDTLSSGIGALTSVFGGSSSDSHIPELPGEVNESKLDVTTEGVPHTDKAEDMSMKREVGDWPSVLGDLNTGHIVIGSGNHHLNKEDEKKSSACKVNYDPSAGIDSDCSDIPGYLPSMLQKPEDVHTIPEENVTVEFPEYGNFTIDLQ